MNLRALEGVLEDMETAHRKDWSRPEADKNSGDLEYQGVSINFGRNFMRL